ncbi:ribosome-associated protein [Comamonas odontotermitis]|uniref:Ribosomal silencing factor RsfS n=1 Tax=Comamonas odontotermitis TaxID=379895 RepID=A0ABR6RKB7_9BURK|nr:ribosome silencing factor [Comamonas odontotermitis]MBB6579459.1 ribosome-associated protein [Comamonas odontotermitis]
MTTAKKSESAAKKSVQTLQRAVVDGLEDVKAQDIQVFNTEHLSPLFERVIVASGTSNRQTKALASSVKDAVKEAGFPKPRTEGEDNGEWIIVDCGSVVAHIMQPMIRQYYRLEEMWGEMPVRLKLGGAKPKAAKPKADADEAAPAKKKPAARKTAAVDDDAAPAKKAVKKPAVKKITGTVAAKPAAKRATKTAGKAPAKPAAAVKKVVVNKPKPAAKSTGKPAAKSVAKPAAKKPAAKRAPAKAK